MPAKTSELAMAIGETLSAKEVMNPFEWRDSSTRGQLARHGDFDDLLLMTHPLIPMLSGVVLTSARGL